MLVALFQLLILAGWLACSSITIQSVAGDGHYVQWRAGLVLVIAIYWLIR